MRECHSVSLPNPKRELKAMEWPLPIACEQPACCEPYKLIA
jgi:hypothetical protein